MEVNPDEVTVIYEEGHPKMASLTLRDDPATFVHLVSLFGWMQREGITSSIDLKSFGCVQLPDGQWALTVDTVLRALVQRKDQAETPERREELERIHAQVRASGLRSSPT